MELVNQFNFILVSFHDVMKRINTSHLNLDWGLGFILSLYS